jgi:hypothetical protein
MNIRSLIIAMLCLGVLTSNAQNELIAERFDSWNSFEMQWVPQDSSEYEYNAEGLRIADNFRGYEEGAWPYERRLEYEYDSEEKLIYTTEFSWLDNQWVVAETDRRTSWEYNSSGLEITRLFEVWSGTDWLLIRRELTLYEEATGLRTEFSEQEYEEGEWVNTYRLLFVEYDNDGNLLQEIQQTWEEGSWEPFIRISQSYNLGLLEQRLIERYEEGEWDTIQRRSYQYSPQGYLESWLQESWDEATAMWVPFYQEIYENNTEGHVLNLLTQSWLPTDGSWRNLIQSSFTYNENSQQVYALTERWNSGQSIWENFSRYFYYYNNGLTSVKAAPEADGEYQMIAYPNPTAGQLTVKINTLHPLSGQLQVCSADGRILQSKAVNTGVNEENQLDISNFPAGIYVIRLETGYTPAQVLINLR